MATDSLGVKISGHMVSKLVVAARTAAKAGLLDTSVEYRRPTLCHGSEMPLRSRAGHFCRGEIGDKDSQREALRERCSQSRDTKVSIVI